MLYSYPCLFCKDENPEFSDEHVIQRAFGSNWTLPRDVCSECNTVKFSPLDGKLLNFVRAIVYPDETDISVRRTLFQEGHHVQFDATSELWRSVRLDKNGRAIVFPQLIFINRNRITFSSSSSSASHQSMLELMIKELSSPNELSFSELVILQEDQSLPSIQPAIIRSSRNSYLIRASDSGDIAFLKQQLLNRNLTEWNQEQAEPEKIQQQGWVYGRLTIDQNDINRALTKSAVNAVCAFLGSDRARHPALDPIKSFILGHTLDDTNKFVEHLWSPEKNDREIKSFQRFNKLGHHTVILAAMERVPLVIFWFYARPFAFVRLAETNFLQEQEIFAALINYQSKSHEIFSLLNDPRLFYQSFYSE